MAATCLFSPENNLTRPALYGVDWNSVVNIATIAVSFAVAMILGAVARLPRVRPANYRG
jgi:hypothetical protein